MVPNLQKKHWSWNVGWELAATMTRYKVEAPETVPISHTGQISSQKNQAKMSSERQMKFMKFGAKTKALFQVTRPP